MLWAVDRPMTPAPITATRMSGVTRDRHTHKTQHSAAHQLERWLLLSEGCSARDQSQGFSQLVFRIKHIKELLHTDYRAFSFFTAIVTIRTSFYFLLHLHLHTCASAKTMLEDWERWAVRLQKPRASLIWCQMTSWQTFTTADHFT